MTTDQICRKIMERLRKQLLAYKLSPRDLQWLNWIEESLGESISKNRPDEPLPLYVTTKKKKP